LKRSQVDLAGQPGLVEEGSLRLLVSVRSAAEAVEALEGGADIIDIKEPGEGSLGEAPAAARQAVVEAVDGQAPVSAALGELRLRGQGWELEHQPGIVLYKLGLSGLGETDWSELLDQARALVGEGSQGEADLVAVAYADWQAAGSPEPGAVLEHALDRKFPFFLVDTYDKQAGDLSTFMDWGMVAVLAERARSGGVRFVAAGKLGAAQLRAAAAAGVDVIAVRGAATTGERTARVDRRAVDELSRLIHEELTPG